LDWVSQAVCFNIECTLPDSIIDGTMRQIKELAFVYSGLGITEVRARLSSLISEILPRDLQGIVFPSSVSEVVEDAIVLAHRSTGKYKVVNWYRSYHDGTTTYHQATGDFRRWYELDFVPG
jgi:4-aminobutyrate aminotransferase-like enzyme